MDASHYMKEWLGKTVIILTALFEIRTFEARISFIQAIRNCLYLCEFAVFYVLLSVEEPVRNFVLARILDDGHDSFNLENSTCCD